MKKHIHLFMLLLVIIPFSGCSLFYIEGSGEITEKEYVLKDFTSIDTNNFCDVTVNEGSEYAVIVSCDNNITPYLDTYVSDNTLHISLRDSYIFRNYTFQATIIMPSQTHINTVEG